ncbi:MAG: hypothetical protein ACLF0G_09665 [Candidatus Brocadiia bacterium]
MDGRWKFTLAVAVAAAGLAVTALSVSRHLGGGPRPFEQRPVPADQFHRIDTLSVELLALQGAARRSRLEEVASPKARAEDIQAVAALLEAMAEAPRWRLAHADAYGPHLVKAIYEVEDRQGRAEPVAIHFERTEEGMAVLGPAP